MDWKREAIDKLRGYEARCMALENISDEIARLNGALGAVKGSCTDATPVSGGGSAYEDTLLNNIVRRQELEVRLCDTQLWVETVKRALGILDEDQAKVLDLLYVRRGKGNVDRLCEELCVEKSSVYRKRDEALEKFTLAFYGV